VGHVLQAWSEDGGRTWSELTPTDLPNPNSGTDAVTLQDGRHLIVYNHTPRGRTPLNVALSSDGKKWLASLVLENEPGEYSYPAVIQGKDGRIHISYTWQRKKVRYVVLDPEKIPQGPHLTGE
jgi:predicted neuraminidase